MEETVYTTSTQYRLFTFTPAQLSALRQSTNASAAQKITESIKRARAARAADAGEGEDSTPTGDLDGGDIQCLTPEEELKLVAYYCIQCMQLSDHFGFPSNVKATALVFLSRFYTATSPLTLHPKKLLLPLLYLSTKTENHYTPISTFISTAATAGLKTTKEELLAPEFTIAMGLRWAFQVWHPFRGLEGIVFELGAMLKGKYQPPPIIEGSQGGEEIQQALLNMGVTEERIADTHTDARKTLTKTALLTDVYFLYSPPQISMAAIWVADEAIAKFYLDQKFPVETTVKKKLLETVRECARNHLVGEEVGKDVENPYPGLLIRLPQNGITVAITGLDQEVLKEVKRIDKKLYLLTNPKPTTKSKTAAPTTAAAAAAPQETTPTETTKQKEETTRLAKKRKMERDALRHDAEVFGMPLGEQG